MMEMLIMNNKALLIITTTSTCFCVCAFFVNLHTDDYTIIRVASFLGFAFMGALTMSNPIFGQFIKDVDEYLGNFLNNLYKE